MTHRTSFAGALVVMAIGAVLAFAVQSTPKFLDLHVAGLILVLGAAADLAIRAAVADSPLLNRQSADVAAVVEPIGDPVLDAAGNPVVTANPATAPVRPPLIAPPPGTMPPGSGADTLIVTDEPQPPVHQGIAAPYDPARRNPVRESGPGRDGGPVGTTPTVDVADALTTPDTPESPVAVTTLTGRPVRPRRTRAYWRR